MEHELGFPKSQPAEYQLAWLQDERMSCMMLLGNMLCKPDHTLEIQECFARIERINQAAMLTARSDLDCSLAR